jgi:hypothetical protein
LVLFAILGFTMIESDVESPKEAITEEQKIIKKEPNLKNVGFFEENQFILFKGDVSKISKYFNLYYVNKMQFIGL